MQAIRYENHTLFLLDQTKLPNVVDTVACRTVEEVANAIKTMVVRGAPAIGASAAFGMAIAAYQLADCADIEVFRGQLRQAQSLLASTRPTAVNLFWALRRIARLIESPEQSVRHLAISIEEEALRIADEDIAINLALSRHGAALMPQRGGVLTHCNAGALATVGYGTALGVIRAAYESGKRLHVYADETRPFWQGARLTAFELQHDHIPVTLITDSMAGFVMQQGKVQAVVVGADRVTCNGDVANKIGTYSLAVLAKEHSIPFYVAVPLSTVDLSLATGRDIPIEQRPPQEVTHFRGQAIAPEGVDVYNPAFDITPHQYVTALVTERGVVYPPFTERLAAYKEQS